MRLFAYYALHALKNQIRKLFKTWIAVFILVCFVMGAVIGIGAAVKNNIDICDDCIIGAGAAVVKNIEKSGIYKGVPARLDDIK